MAKPRPKRPDDELRALSGHVLYEIEMFAFTADCLSAFSVAESSAPVKTLQNAVLESWTLHARNLLTFLYEDRPKAHDVTAADFLDQDWPAERGTRPDVLRTARARAAREIAHISDYRLQVTAAEKPWQVEPI